EPLNRGAIDQIVLFPPQAVEEEHAERQLPPHSVHVEPAPEATHGCLKWLRPSIGAQCDRLAVEDQQLRRQCTGGFDEFGRGRGNVVEPPAVDAYLLTGFMYLNARSI